MSGPTKTQADLEQGATGRARHGVEQAEAGNAAGLQQIDKARKVDPAGVEAVEQEASDGPEGRGVSR